MSTKQIDKISIFQSSKMCAAMFFVIAAIVAIPAGIVVLLQGDVSGVGIFFIPFLAAAFYFVIYAIMFWFYNVIASMVGGIEIELKDVE